MSHKRWRFEMANGKYEVSVNNLQGGIEAYEFESIETAYEHYYTIRYEYENELTDIFVRFSDK